MDTSTDLTDFMGFMDLLSEEERLVRLTARQFVNQEILPIIDQCAQQETFPTQLIEKMGNLGMLGSNLPQAF